jgi:hypothetical protein
MQPERSTWQAGGRILQLFAVAFAGMVAISSFHCGDEEINEANIGPKLAAALCDAENTCCTSQGYPQSADRRMICEATAQAGLFHPDGYVFNADVAAQCLKAAQAYKCRDRTSIDDICRYYTDCVVWDYCDSTMTCMPTLPDGAPCTSTSECKSTNCMNGVCMSRGACSLV